ncbi:MAG: hypothetical protein LC109_14020 [Bacteroidia bacterium]|nr:hypothetical protein [Bacteroidia bacterium]
MKNIIILLFTLLATSVYGQDKYNYVQFNKLTEIKGTTMLSQQLKMLEKCLLQIAKYLLFLNTSSGQTKQVDFPKDAISKN